MRLFRTIMVLVIQLTQGGSETRRVFFSVSDVLESDLSLRLVNNLMLSFTIFFALNKILLFLNSFKGCNLAFMTLVVIFPSLYLVSLDQSSIDPVCAVENRATVLLYIDHIFLIKLKIILCTSVHVARLSDKHRGHLVCYKLLSTIQCSHGSERGQSLSLDELDQVHFFVHACLSLCHHRLES